MSELEQLKKRIDDSGQDGVETAHIREDYEPVGREMIHSLCLTDQYVQRKVDQRWKVFKKGCEPY